MGFISGDVVMKCKPFVHTLNQSQKSFRCDYCFKQNQSLNKCSKCKQMFYCDKNCQKHDWIQCHKSECNVYYEDLNRDCDRFLLRLWLKTQSKSHSLVTTETHQLYNGLSRGFDDLITHYHEIHEDMKRMKCFNDIYNRFKSYDLDIDYEILLQLFCKICINSFSILNEDLNQIGSGLYICGSVLNHSCEPNATIVFNGIHMEVRALKTIDSTHEVLINYLDLKMCGTDRRSRLREQYYFDCKCNKCLTLSDNNIDYNLVDVLNKEFDELIDSGNDWQKCYQIGMKSIPLYEEIYGHFHPDLTVQLMRVLKVKALISDDLRDINTLDLIKKTQNAIEITHGFQHKLYQMFKQFVCF